MKPYPLLFHPVYKDYLWGGDRIPRVFKRDLPPGIYAESWEVSDRVDGMGVVANGELAGQAFADVVRAWGRDLLGVCVTGKRFPLLIKLIDSRERLSVQVHPNDDTAARFGGEAKTECWYLVDADPGAGVFAGFKEGVDPDAYDRAVETGTTGELLHRIPVQAGDAVFIPGGLVHAIDAGCLILEVQQNSNTTYRIDDWGRVGPDGKPRELHVEQARQVIRWDLGVQDKATPVPVECPSGNRRWRLAATPYFQLDRLVIDRPQPVGGDGESFVVLFAASGEAALTWPGGRLALPPGTTCLIPATLAGCEVTVDVETTLLHVTVPSASRS